MGGYIVAPFGSNGSHNRQRIVGVGAGGILLYDERGTPSYLLQAARRVLQSSQ